MANLKPYLFSLKVFYKYRKINFILGYTYNMNIQTIRVSLNIMFLKHVA